jgi:hypothetical protein
MEKEILISLGLIVGYLLFRFIGRIKHKTKNATNVYSDILTNDKYKVKGQWDR